MARSFNGSSDAIQASLNLSAYDKITVCFWLNWTTFANNDALAMESSANFGTHVGGILIDPNSSGGNFEIGINGNVTQITPLTDASFTRPSSGVFHHYAFQFDVSATGVGNAAIPAVYVDGASQSLTYALSGAVGSTNFGNYTWNFMCRNAASLFGAGSMADVSIHSVLLTAGEIGALFRGARAKDIRPTSLIKYWPLDGISSPEPDLAGLPSNGTLTGTTNASGPPVTMFTRRWAYSEIIVSANLVYARPDADNTDGSWTNELNSQTDLFASIDETAADDADYIISSNNPQSDICKISLSNPGGVTTPCKVRYRYRKRGEASLPANMQVTLLQGSTTIAQWNHNAITGSFVSAEQTLSAPEFASISDFNDLYLQFNADIDAF